MRGSKIIKVNSRIKTDEGRSLEGKEERKGEPAQELEGKQKGWMMV